MKKLLTVVLASVLSAATLTSCGKSTARAVSDKQYVDNSATRSQSVETPDTLPAEPGANDKRNINITIDGEVDGIFGAIGKRAPISGVQRRFIPSLEGDYAVEYVHTPYGEQNDDTLDYKFTLNDDNTYDMTVVSDGVTVTHTGHWYERGHSITFFYDEDVDPTAHNVYVCDVMYGDILKTGKIMIYDNCRTIVLSKSDRAESTRQKAVLFRK